MTFIDLFSGMGGFRIAFESAGNKCIFSSEIDKYARETYKNNFQDYPEGDITKILSKDIPDFDILCAGFPCQPFSIAGKRLGFEDSRGTLFFEVARILKEKQPVAFLLENVRGITNHDGGNTIKVIMNTLDEIGYSCKDSVINALDYGIPQNRERWYCIGFRKDLHIDLSDIDLKQKKSLMYDLSSIIKQNNDSKYAISDICYQNIMKHVELKKIEVDDYTLAYEIRPSRCQFATKNYSPCLTAKMGTGGNNVPVVIKQKRRLTEEECLKIMGYPSSYKVGRGSHGYKQIGNSVVVTVISQLAQIITQKLKDTNS
ncbi:MAG: DNA (cytosine-5-)-methyltransferase [Treponema sp.]|nr:DNA (cytosine-5-)-methyltransferase [Spirochaetia bacterium]MDY2838780.1 DNA (cytosine-5-)-methyltransferase [Treponema sp.]